MTFSSVDLKDYLAGDKKKVRNYFSALRRYLKVDTKTNTIKCIRNGVPSEMYACIMHCDVAKANKLATVKLQSTNLRTNKQMWMDIKVFTESKLKG